MLFFCFSSQGNKETREVCSFPQAEIINGEAETQSQEIALWNLCCYHSEDYKWNRDESWKRHMFYGHKHKSLKDKNIPPQGTGSEASNILRYGEDGASRIIYNALRMSPGNSTRELILLRNEEKSMKIQGNNDSKNTKVKRMERWMD